MFAESVSFDEALITRKCRNGDIERVRWDDLIEVSILTTDEGPFNEDFYWVLTGSKSGCLIGLRSNGTDALLERLQSLPDFNNKAFLEAFGCSENKRFICWRKNTILDSN
jgi:hypothetical protein